jgi:uncharacterized protein YjbJ (UPF0337 family)
MGERTDPLDRLDGEPYAGESVNDATVIEDTGPQPVSEFAEPMNPTGVPAAGIDTVTMAEAPMTDGSGDDEIDMHRVQIEQTRAEMSHTIDAIQEKLSPGTIAQHAKDAVRDATVGKAQDMVSNAAGTAQGMVNNATDAVSTAGGTARDVGSGIWETIRQNPVPAALAGIGIGWLVVSGRRSGTRTYTGGYARYPYAGTGYSPTGQYAGYASPYSTRYAGPAGYESRYPREYGAPESDAGSTGRVGDIAGRAQGAANEYIGQVQDAAGQYVGQAQNLANQAAASAQQTAGQVAGTVQATAGQMADQLQGAAQNMAQNAQYGAQQAQSGFQQMLQSAPLAVAAGAVALGVAIGLAIPETEKENELMGPARDALMDQAQQTVQEKAQQVQTVAQQAVGAAKDAAQQAADEQGLTT